MKCPYCNHEMNRTVTIRGKEYKAARKTETSRKNDRRPIPVLIVRSVTHADK